MHRAFLLLLCAALPLLAAPPWQLRYGYQPDQKPEWTAVGRVPAFTIAAEGETVTFADHPDGRCRGWVFAARPLTLPEEAPGRVVAELEYQTFCSLDAPQVRSGTLHVFLATPEAWATLAEEPDAGEPFNPGRPPKGMVMAGVTGHGPDVLEWKASGAIRFGSLGEEMRTQRTLLAGVAWGTYHFNEERGGFRKLRWTMQTQEDIRREFWLALDLERPELAAVRKAVEAKDEPASIRALATHYRQRQGPVVGNPVGVGSAGTIKRADENLAHTYRLAGCPVYTFEDEIVWNADPFNYNQWPVAINRHVEWRHLAGAYLKTKDEKYAVEWNAQVRHWVAAMPVLIAPGWIQGPFNTPGKTSLSLDAGIRTGQTWFPSFAVFKNSPSVTDEAIVDFVRSGWEHGGYLMKPQNFRLASNWGAMESNGLYHLGVMLPEFKDAGLWRETAVKRTMEMIDYQVYPDGAQTELAPGYHGVSLSNFLGVMRLARANDLTVPEDFAQRLEGMFDYYLKIADPDLRTPNLNDSGSGSVIGQLRRGVELFPERQDFLWAAERRRKGTEPGFLSYAMPWAGWVMMRSDWSSKANYLLFDAGPFGSGHQHEDKLGILLHAFGKRLISECGVYAYDTSQWRRYCLSTRGHSSVRMDDQDQNCRRDRPQHRAEEADVHGFFDSPAATYARDAHVSGYGDPADKSVTHRRRVLFLKPDLYLVVDDLAATDAREHEVEIQFLLNAEGADLGDGHVAISRHEPDQPAIGIIPLRTDGLASRIAQGETEPMVRGFIPKGFEKLEPAPAVLYTRKFTGQLTLAWLLVPFQADKMPVRMATTKQTDGATNASMVLATGETAEVHLTPTTLTWKDATRAFSREEPSLLPGD
jgi:hypothetical protein